MITIKKILCPVDFFAASVAAVSYAAGLAYDYHAELHLLHVVAPEVPSAFDVAANMFDMRNDMEDASGALEMKELETRVNQIGVSVQVEMRRGDVYDEINRAIETLKPELVVMGTHGRRGVARWLMGSTTEKLLRHSPVPLVTISATGEQPLAHPRLRRILVTTDFSEGTADALSYAFSVAEENQARITLLHVVDDVAADESGKYREPLIAGVRKQLDDLVPPEARNWCDVDTRVETGLPYRTILRVLEDEKIDLLVMNIHGKGMVDRALVGSNAERVVRAASCPVMLIPPMDSRSRVAA